MEPGREGGTWMALGKKDNIFKFGALLNITGEPRDKDALGRGHLVGDYLRSTQSNDEYSKQLIRTELTYTGYNLVTIEIG